MVTAALGACRPLTSNAERYFVRPRGCLTLFLIVTTMALVEDNAVFAPQAVRYGDFWLGTRSDTLFSPGLFNRRCPQY